MKTINSSFLVLFIALYWGLQCSTYGQDIRQQLQAPKSVVLKLNRNDKGMKVAAAEGRTLGQDSVQLFTIKPLDIMEPVYVSIMTKFPQFKFDVSFYGDARDEPASVLSNKGKKAVNHLFRTQGEAVIGISSAVEGMPYLVSIMIGKKFPVSSAPMIRVTDNINEYRAFYGDQKFEAAAAPTSREENALIKDKGKEKSEHTNMLYVVIGLLVAILALSAFFYFKKMRSTNFILIMLMSMVSSQTIIAQEQVFILETENIEPSVSNYTVDVFILEENGVPVTDYEGFIENYDLGYADSQERHDQNVNVPDGAKDISGTDEAREMGRTMKEERRRFEENYYEDMPGRFDPDKDSNTVRPDISAQEIASLRRRIRDLEIKVALLSEKDRENLPPPRDKPIELIYCKNIESCMACLQEKITKLNDLEQLFHRLNAIYTTAETYAADGTAFGDAMASIPGFGLGWTEVRKEVQQSRRELARSYVNKFNEFMTRLDSIFDEIHGCKQAAMRMGQPDALREEEFEMYNVDKVRIQNYLQSLAITNQHTGRYRR
ncbi:hypothetical protein [Croceiramulus getboli]|nr:hypothetical protein P8624_09680 [Flavobacteriaceae bacterium YJPT1-3]